MGKFPGTFDKAQVYAALISAIAGILVGITTALITVYVTRYSANEARQESAASIRTQISTSANQIAAQLEASSLTHSDDVFRALHDSVGDLVESRNDAAHRAQLSLASVYFLGTNAAERKQILETAAITGNRDLRGTIGILLRIDHQYGAQLVKDAELNNFVLGELGANGAQGTTQGASHNEVPSTRSETDGLANGIARLNAIGYVYLGQALNNASATQPLIYSNITSRRVPRTRQAVQFANFVRFRSGPPLGPGEFASRLGTVRKREFAVVMTLAQPYALRRNVVAVWAQVLLCDSVTVPPAGKEFVKYCPAQSVGRSGSVGG